MNIQTISIGEYQMSPSISFCLYQIPSPLVTPPLSNNNTQKELEYFNYFCLEDLFAIFDLHSIKQDLIQSFQYFPGFYCKQEDESKNYIQTHIMADIAVKHNLYNLVDLCKLSDKELLLGGAIPLLKMTTCLRLNQKPTMKSTILFRPKPLNGNEWFFKQENIKLEPFSPTLSPPIIITTTAPNTTTIRPQLQQERLSFESLSSSSSHINMMEEEDSNLIKLPKPSSLLLKRLAPKHGYKKNLTILTPSYNEDPTNGIQSAPLRRTIIPPIQHRSNTKNKINKKNGSNLSTKSTQKIRWPQTSVQSRFPSPPIVPSQQPSWGQQYRRKLTPPTPSTATIPQPLLPSKVLSQKQKFLQPFEYLYDHIEQTRVLKTSLDDQIRRSSSLMQTLQSSSTMVESIVRKQVRDMVDEKFDQKLRDCTERITRLEYRTVSTNIPISPAVSPTTALNKDQPQDVLTQLLNRIDQLESKLLLEK